LYCVYSQNERQVRYRHAACDQIISAAGESDIADNLVQVHAHYLCRQIDADHRKRRVAGP
jgi:hypothetical protein